MLRNLLRSAVFSLAVFTALSSFAGPAVLIEEDGVPIKPLSGRSTLKETYSGQEFGNSYDLREKRRVGVGIQMSGLSGLYGIFAELNVNPSNSGVIGFGGGPGYSSFYGNWKYLFSENRFSPYIGLGYAHWYDATGAKDGLAQTNPKFLTSKFLNSLEKETGRFQIDLLTASAGLQYHVLSGPYVGFSFFTEIDLLVRTINLAVAPTGTVGSIYYF